MVREDDRARQGFLTDELFERLVQELPSYLKPLTVVAYNTGIRLGELLTIRWEQVDFEGGLIRLKSGETKTGSPRTVPMMGAMRDVLVRAKEERDQFWPDCVWVFQRLGERIREFRFAWDSACERAGLPELLFHDLRRSAARNLSRAGTPERVIMAITGHKTRAMFDRYNIVSESDLMDAAAKLELFRKTRNDGNQNENEKN
jgi:integrase